MVHAKIGDEVVRGQPLVTVYHMEKRTAGYSETTRTSVSDRIILTKFSLFNGRLRFCWYRLVAVSE